MTDHLSLEQRIDEKCKYFENNNIEYDKNFVIEQVTEQYPWKDPWNSSVWTTIYSKIYPTKEAKDDDGVKYID